jgi:hypothetical protein
MAITRIKEAGIPTANRIYSQAKGAGVPSLIVTNTIMRDSYVMRDSIRMTDNG